MTSSYGLGRLDYDRDLLDELAALAPTITEDTAQASIDALLSSADHYRSPEDYRNLIRFVGRLPAYAPFNRMLVHLQDPGAVYVATAAKWRRDFGRGIKPGARPLVVMRPRGPVMIVFDVRHTEPVVENPPPVPTKITDPVTVRYATPEQEIDRRWAYIVHNAVRDGIRITHVDHGGSACGRATHKPKSGVTLERTVFPKGQPTVEKFPLRYDVEINENMAPRDQYATLVHELAHILCGHLGSPNTDYWPDRKEASHEVGEVEAESVAHMVLSRIDPDVAMGDYIQGHLDNEGQVPRGLSLNAMMKAAGVIEEMGDGRMPRRKPKERGKR